MWTFFYELGMEHNFEKYAHRDIDNLNIQYDYKSLMHYGNYAFSKNGLKTLRALADPSIKFGQRDRFSSLDVQELNALYDCSGTLLKCHKVKYRLKYINVTNTSFFLPQTSDPNPSPNHS